MGISWLIAKVTHIQRMVNVDMKFNRVPALIILHV